METKNPDLMIVYGAFTTLDEYGRTGKCKGWYTSGGKANKAAKGIGWYGGMGKVEMCYAVKASSQEGYYILRKPIAVVLDKEIDDRDELKRSALAKLTKEEKKALGL